MIGRKKARLNEEELYNYAIRLLSGRSLSVGEVRQRLKQRAEEGSGIDTVIAKLREYGFLDDNRFAEYFSAARRDNEGFGQMRVLQDLKKRHISGELAEQATGTAFSEVDEMEQATRYLERKYRSKNIPEFLSIEKNMASAYRRLRIGGFSSGTTIRLLKQYSQRAEELEGMEDGNLHADPE